MNDPGVEYRLYLDQFKQDVGELKTLMTGVGNETEKEADKLDQLTRRIGTGLAAIFAIDRAVGFVKNVALVRGEFEKLEVVLANSIGAKEAAKVMKQISEFAAKTPFQLNELTDSFVKLTNQGFQPTMEEMTNLGDLAAHTGKTFDMLAEAVIDAQVGENERLKEFGIRAQKNGDIIAYTFKGITTEVENNSTAIQQYILSLGQLDGVAGSMEAISGTIPGMLSNLEDAIDSMFNQMGEGAEGTIKDIIGWTTNLVENWENVVNILEITIATVGAYKAATMTMHIMEQVKAAGSLAKAIKSATVAQKALNLAQKMNPIGLVVAGLTAAVGAFFAYRSSMDDVIAVGEEFQKELSSERSKLDMVFGALEKTTEGTDARKEAVTQANKILGEYNITQFDEKSNLDDIKEAYDLVNEAIVNNMVLKHQQKELDEAMNTFVDKTMKSYSKFYSYLKDQGKSSIASIISEDAKTFAKAHADVIKKIWDVPIETLSRKEQVEIKKLRAQLSADVNKFAKDHELSYKAVNGYIVKFASSYNNLLEKQEDIKNFYSGYVNVIKKVGNAGTDAIDAEIKSIKDLNNELKKLQKQRQEATDINDKEELDRLATLIKAKQAEIAKFKINAEKKQKKQTELEKFKEELEKEKQAYKEYEAVKTVIGKEEADKLYSSLLIKAKTYKQSLDNILKGNLTKDQTAVISLELSGFSKKPEQKGKDDGEAYAKGVIEATRTIDDKINDLFAEYDKNREVLAKRGLDDQIVILDQKLQADLDYLMKANGQYAWLFKSIENYSRQELKNFIATIKDKLDKEKISNELRLEMHKKLAEAEEALDNKLSKNLNDVATIFGELSTLAGEFNDELAKGFDHASNLASAAASIAIGITSNNPVAVVQGIIQGVTELVRIGKELFGNEKESKELLEGVKNNVNDLKDEFEDLKDVIDETFGVEKIKAFNNAVFQTKESIQGLENLYGNIKEATEAALDQNSSFSEYFTGDYSDAAALNKFRTTWSKLAQEYGEGSKKFYEELLNSGQLPEDVRKQVEEIIENWDYYLDEQARLLREQVELLTGISVSGLGDEIVQMFKDGEIAAEDFAAKFEDLMKNAIIEIFKQKIIMDEMEGWYDYLTELMDDDGDGTIEPDEGLSAQDKELLKDDWEKRTGIMRTGWDFIKEMYPEMELPNNTNSPQSKAGAISNVITEETAGVFTGHVANIRMNMADVVSIATRQLNTLNKIEGHTRRLEKMESYLSEMNDNLGGLRSYGS